MPTTCPWALNSGPPELPGLTATSDWMKGTELSSGSERPLALTTPAVTVFSNPKGEPMASTQSPARSAWLLPIGTVGRLCASIFSTAMSVFGSMPSTLALNSRRSVSLTVTVLAPLTTCALVMIKPSALMMKPDPRPRTGTVSVPPLGPCWSMPGGMPKRRMKSRRPGSMAAPPLSLTFSVPLTLMLTTAGPSRAAMVAKSGAVTTPIGPGAAAVATTAGCCANTGVEKPRTAVTPAPPTTPAANTARARREDLNLSEFMISPFKSCPGLGRWGDCELRELGET